MWKSADTFFLYEWTFYVEKNTVFHDHKYIMQNMNILLTHDALTAHLL